MPPEEGLRLVVLDRLGLRADARVLSLLGDAVAQIAQAQRATVAEVYRRCLEEPLSGLASHLAGRLSVSESSFFRHQAHFDVLEQHLIPALRRGSGRQGLRVLSAGCAKGEEVYSLAISCRRAWPEGAHHVVGFDVSESSLEAAKAGRFRAWSLRGVDPRSLAPHLTPAGQEEWEVSAALKREVSFVRGNLLELPQAVRNLAPFDVVLCRNVLIYFSREAGRAVARALSGLLAPGGAMLVGPADHDFCAELACRQQEQVYLYGEVSPAASPGPAPLALEPGPTAPPEPAAAPPRPPVLSARPPLARDAYEALLAAGRAARDLGQEEAALQRFDQSMALIPDRPEAYFEQALLLDHRRLFPPARELLERALYLDPCFVPALVVLSRVLHATGERARARAVLESLESSLRELPPDEPVGGWAEMTAGALVKSCRTLLRASPQGSG